MGQFVNLWLSYAVSALDSLEPEMQRTRMLWEDPGFPDRFLVSGGRDHLANPPPADRMPEFMALYGARDGAAPALLSVILAVIDRRPAPNRRPIPSLPACSNTP